MFDFIYDTIYNEATKENDMSQLETLLQKICALDQDLRFDELQKVLERYGYTMKETSGGSSHATFRKKGRRPLTIPRHRPIKTVYLEMLKEVIESEENQ